MGSLIRSRRILKLEDDLPPQELKTIREALLIDKAALKTALHRDFLHIVDCLRLLLADSESKNDRATAILKWWTDLAGSVGMNEVQMREEVISERKRVTKKEVLGCSWYKCLRFEHEGGSAPLFACAGCGEAMYCGPACQNR